MDLLNRHRNLTILVAVLFAQVIGLAVQVKRPAERGPVRLIRIWGINLITPAENALVHTQDWIHHTWRNYFYLRDVRSENERLQEENLHLRLEQVRMAEDASQAQRLQALLKFKEQFISDTVAAQVIGSSGSEMSRVIYIDRGSDDGVKTDMAVITPGGIVGKVIRVFTNTAQVLEINDQSSGVGAILEKSRLQGILKGTPAGETMVHYIMTDEKVEVGEMVLTSGGDRIFPKGLPIGQVVQVNPGPDTFLNIRVKPAARLERVEEVLVITRVVEKDRDLIPQAPMRASEILSQRLPTVPVKAQPPQDAAAASAAGTTPPAGTAAGTQPPATGVKPATASAGTTKPAVTPAISGKPPTPGAVKTVGSNPSTPGTAKPVASNPTPGIAKPVGSNPTTPGTVKPGANTGATGKSVVIGQTLPATTKPAGAVKQNSAAAGVALNANDDAKLKAKKPVAQNQSATPTKVTPQ